MTIARLPLPQRCNTVEDALGAARMAGINNCLILSETSDGFLILNAGDGEPMTLAQCTYLLRRAEHVMLSGNYGRTEK